MNFCNLCASPLQRLVPEGDSLHRDVCSECGHIHYQNPRIITGCIPAWGEQVLMCKRAIEPRYGLWTLPAGFLELGETSSAGGVRETWEEARAQVEVGPLFSLINVTYIGQIYTFYQARLLNLDFGPGPESLEVELMREHEIPWDELAFPTVRLTLRDYFADLARGELGLHTHDLTQSPWRKKADADSDNR